MVDHPWNVYSIGYQDYASGVQSRAEEYSNEPIKGDIEESEKRRSLRDYYQSGWNDAEQHTEAMHSLSLAA
jgi:hypothetical protein